MKKLLAIMLVMGAAYFSFAIDATFTIAPDSTAHTSNYVNGPLLVTALQFINGSITLPNTITIYDSPQTNSSFGPAQGNDLARYSNGTYTTVSTYMTNISVVYTGFSGSKWTNTERFVRDFTNSVGGTTNEFRRVFQFNLGAGVGTTLTIPIGANGVWFSRGLTVSNSALNTNIQFNVSYAPGL
jgi:hypothetical protein